MSSKRPETALYYNEIASIEPDFVYLAGYLYIFQETDEEFTRLMRVQGDEWLHVFDMDEVAWSVCAFSDSSGKRNCVLLGRNGGVKAYWGTTLYEASIPIKPGKLFEIRRIGETLFACGSLHQVFYLSPTGWTVHDNRIVKDRAKEGNAAFFGIHGMSEVDFYCVGRFGVIAHYNGTSYDFVDSPTNRHLERVHCRATNEIYVCGRDGVLLKGDGAAWTDINDAGCDAHFWGIADFQGQMYFCTDSEMYVYDGHRLSLVQVGIDESPSFYRMTATSRYLWATTGKDYILRFDGSRWEKLISSQS